MFTFLNVFLSSTFAAMGSWSVVTKHWFLAFIYYALAGLCYFVVWVSTGKTD